MTPKEKAVKLVNIYIDEVINETDINFPLELPKRLALIAVDELILNCSHLEMYYWNQVKQEINEL